MPDTMYTVSPHWGWYAVIEFLIAGLAGTAAGIAALLWLFGRRPADIALARWGFGIATVGSMMSGILLILDLKRPDRFWHMLVLSKTYMPTFTKWWSVMALGAWSLFIFGGASFFILVGSLASMGKAPSQLAFLAKPPFGLIIALISGLAGTFYAGYKGVLLNATNRPLWGDTTWLGAVLYASGLAASSALLLYVARSRSLPQIAWLRQLLFGALGVTLVSTLGMLATMDRTVISYVLQNIYGIVLAVALVAGVAVPLIVLGRPQRTGRLAITSTMALVLAGAFLLRVALLLSSEAM